MWVTPTPLGLRVESQSHCRSSRPLMSAQRNPLSIPRRHGEVWKSGTSAVGRDGRGNVAQIIVELMIAIGQEMDVCPRHGARE